VNCLNALGSLHGVNSFSSEHALGMSLTGVFVTSCARQKIVFAEGL
jgi:hypothetical protein